MRRSLKRPRFCCRGVLDRVAGDGGSGFVSEVAYRCDAAQRGIKISAIAGKACGLRRLHYEGTGGE